VDGYRSPALQQQLWSATREEIAGTHPLATPSEIDRLTRLVVARPGREGGGRQTGAAVDITLADAVGTELWMGTGVREFTTVTRARAKVTDTVGWRRQLLTRCLTEVEFINYPAEWWHFSMGDRLWAAYVRHPAARFGPVTVEELSKNVKPPQGRPSVGK
jgi:zinc D-Ala-D-Ala dipeptidase